MQIEYFDLGPKERPVVLIYGNEPEKVASLVRAVHSLVSGERKRFAVHELEGFSGVDGCQLFFSVATSDRGVRRIGDPRTFECSLRPFWWENVEGLLEPFSSPGTSSSHQFLDTGFDSDIELIVSAGRGW